MLKKQELLQTIVGKLAYLKSVVSSFNAIHFFDLNVVAEDFFASLLNEVYGYNLVNLNHTNLNKAAIDLGDPDRRVAFQVTSQRTKAKIQHTLEGFAKHGLEREYDTVKILIIGDRTGEYPTLEVPPPIQFVGTTDVIDMNQLIKEINKLDVPRLKRIARLVEQEIDEFPSYGRSRDPSAIDGQTVLRDPFLTVLEMTRADGELLNHREPPPASELTVSAYLRDDIRLDQKIGTWLLLWAASRGLHQIVGRLLQTGCHPDWRIDETPAWFDLQKGEMKFFWPGGTALHLAARQGNIPVMRQLIEAGASIDVRDREDSTPLHVAAGLRETALRHIVIWASETDRKFGDPRPQTDDDLAFQAVRFLLSKRANPSLPDGQGRTPIEISADFPDMLRLILARTDTGVQAALWLAASQLRQPSIDLLIDANADVNHPNSDGQPLLKHVVERFNDLPNHKEYQSRVADLVDHLLEQGADVSLSDSHGETALHAAVHLDAIRIVESLLRFGADPGAQSSRCGMTPLFYAQSSEVTKALLSAGADLNVRDCNGFCALDHAIIFHRSNALHVLKGTASGPTAITPALRSIRAGDDPSLLHAIDADTWRSARDLDGEPIGFWAVRMLNAGALAFLLDRGVSIAVQNRSGRTLLAAALTSVGGLSSRMDSWRDVITVLREAGADPRDDGRGFHCCFSGFAWWYDEKIAPWILRDATSDLRDRHGETLLMRAVTYGTLAHVQSLLRDGSDVDETDDNGRSALFHCVTFYHSEEDALKAQMLLEAGANLNLSDRTGATPLMRAAACGCREMAHWLLENGADRNARDQLGRNAYEWALRQTRMPELINLVRV